MVYYQSLSLGNLALKVFPLIFSLIIKVFHFILLYFNSYSITSYLWGNENITVDYQGDLPYNKITTVK